MLRFHLVPGLMLLGALIPGPLSDPDAADVRGVRAAIAAFDAAMNARDTEAVMAALAPSDELTLFLPLPYVPMRIDGSATARKSFEILFQNLPKQSQFTLSRHQTVVQVQGPTALSYSYESYYLNAGELPRKLLCRATMVLVKQDDGRWKIMHLHSGAFPEIADFFPQPPLP